MDASPNSFVLVTPEGKGILGDLDEHGVVTFAIEAGEGSSIRGTEMFNRMMGHFGDKVRAIHGSWRKNASGLPSTNIDKVNELIAEGVSLDKAVQEAWTVTRAKKPGYLNVRIFGQPEGTPGAYVKVEVLIEK
jgi:hypothetical protein